MIIQIAYDDGRIDMFDTVSFTAAQPFATANMLTNFELRLDQLGERGLWLAAHYYDVAPAYREGLDADDIPVARRRKGWRFLLAQASEVAHIECVEMDGAPVLKRAGGTLFDYGRFERTAAAVLGTQPTALYPRILALFAFYERQHETLGLSMDPDDIAGEFGFTAATITAIEAEYQSPATMEECPQEEEWEEQR